MKLFLFLCGLVVVSARPQEGFEVDRPRLETLADAGIIRMENEQNEDGSFRYGFETADQIQQDVSGQIKQFADGEIPKFGVVMQGTYSFVAKNEKGEDVPVTVNWTADENGFQADGNVIPRAPQGNLPDQFL